MCLDLRLIALKIYWSKGQGCVRITAEGIKFVEGNKDVSSTGPFQLNGGRWVLLTSRERQWSGCVVWGNNVTQYHWSYWRCVRERKNCLRMQGFFANTIQRRAWPSFSALQFSLNLFRWEELNKPDAARTVSRFANILHSPRWRLDRLWGKRLNGSYQWATFVNNQNGCCRWAICSGFLEKMQLSYIYKKKKLEQELQSSLKALLSQRDGAAPTFSSRWLCVCPVVCRGKSVYALWHCHLCGRLELTSPTSVSSLRDDLHFRTVSIPKMK